MTFETARIADAGAIDFDAWREEYATASFEDQVAFYSLVWGRYPVQRSWSWSPFAAAAESLPGHLRVVELGGWDGTLAARALSVFPEIVSWWNLDLCREALAASVTDDPRYHPVALTAHIWEDPSQVPECDLAVATHTFEHLTLEHTLGAVDALNPKRALYVEIPIAVFPVDWSGYRGSHIFEGAWSDLERGLSERGYRIDVHLDETCRLYHRG